MELYFVAALTLNNKLRTIISKINASKIIIHET